MAPRARRGDDDVHVLELGLDRVEARSAAAEAAREPLGPLDGAVGDEDALNPARDQVHGGEVAHLPRAEHEDAPSLERPEDALGELGRRGGDGGRVLPDGRFAPHPAAHAEGLAEEAVHQLPRRSRLLRSLVGAAHLAENLCLAGDHRVEARRHAEEVHRGRLVGQRVERRGDLALAQFPERCELREGSLLGGLGIVVDDVELGAVAGGERDRLALLTGQPADELRVLRRADVELLAELDGGPVVRGADEDEVHG